MSTATRNNIGSLGLKILAGEGTAAGTVPAWAHSFESGIPKIVQSEDFIPQTIASGDLQSGRYKSESHWEVDSTFWATPRATGAWLKAGLGGLSTAGTADPYTHTLINTPASLPFVAISSLSSGTRNFIGSDGTISELNLNFAAGQPLKLNVKASGKTSLEGTAWTATVDESPSTSGNWFTMIGGTFLLDEATTPAATATTNIESGTVSITRGVELIQTGALTPSHRSLGLFGVGVTFDMLFADWKAYLATFTGSTTGTVDSATIVAGALSLAFAQGPATSANRTLTVALQNCRLMVNDPPDVDSGGGPLRVSVSGVTWKPTSGEIITATLKSQDATY